MGNFYNQILCQSVEHLNVILLMGLAIFFGTAGARFFQYLRIPKVVGYVVIGLIIGESGLNLIGQQTVQNLSSFNMFALGIIGFMIGGELKKEVFEKYGKQFFAILISEGVAAFLFVGILSGLTIYYFKGDVKYAFAMAVVIGAIASATAPAATVNVLWEYKTRGPLTTAILAIVALDDCLALLLYSIASSLAAAVLGQGNGSMLTSILIALVEIIGSIILGVVAGLVLGYILKLIKEPDKALTFTVSSVLLVIGLSIALHLGSILAAMTLGVTLANLPGQRKRTSFELIEKFSPPIYVLFFVLAGAHLVINDITGWMVVVVVVYLIGRSGGKVAGSWFGAKIAKAPPTVSKYLGMCLLSQAGVAIGLAIISSRLFAGEAGHAIIIIVMTTTFIVEIVGPLFVKLGVKKAGEVGLNITEEDLIQTYRVEQVMDTKVPAISTGSSIGEVIAVFSSSDSYYYPVVDNKNRLLGAISLEGIKNTFTTQELNDWLVALDIMEPIGEVLTPGEPLAEAIEKSRQFGLEYLPVVESGEDYKFKGILNIRAVHRHLSAEVLQRQQQADHVHSLVT